MASINSSDQLDDRDSPLSHALVITELRFDGSNISGLPEKTRGSCSRIRGCPWSCLL